MEKGTVKLLGEISGAFFIAGGLLIAFGIAALTSITLAIGGTAHGTGPAELVIAAVGIIAGVVIIVISGSILVSHSRAIRAVAALVIMVAAIYASIFTLGGLVVGVVLAFVASIIAIFMKNP